MWYMAYTKLATIVLICMYVPCMCIVFQKVNQKASHTSNKNNDIFYFVILNKLLRLAYKSSLAKNRKATKSFSLTELAFL